MNRKELFTYLKTNEKQLIQEKTSGVKFSENCHVTPSIVSKVTPREVGTKAAGDTTKPELDSEEGVLLVKVVANTANWMDSYGDVVTSDAYSESITKRGITIPHIIDHNHLL